MKKLAIHGGLPVRKEGFAEWPIYDELEEKMLLDVLHSGKWGGVGGVKSDAYQAKIPKLEQEFARLHEAKYAVACNNGTVAITIALQAVGVKPGDEVIIPPYTFIATASAALAYGVIPVFADIEADTLQIDPISVEKAITPKTTAIIAVHVAGAPANMGALKKIAEKYNLKLIEDAAQAVGASWEHMKVGAIGDVGTFSFQSSKNINSGEGGMVVTNSKEIWENVWSYVNVGRIPEGGWYQHERIGQNYRLTEFQAAVALAQLTRLERQMQVREKNAALLDQLLAKIDGLTIVPPTPGTTRHAYHLYMFRLTGTFAKPIHKHEFIEQVNAEGIPIGYGYTSLNRNRAIIDSIRAWTGETGETRIDECPVSERLCDHEVLWLPQTVLLSDRKAMEDIAEALDKVLATYR